MSQVITKPEDHITSIPIDMPKTMGDYTEVLYPDTISGDNTIIDYPDAPSSIYDGFEAVYPTTQPNTNGIIDDDFYGGRDLTPLIMWMASEGVSNAEITAGKNFKDHFLRHKGLLQDITGKKYPKYKTNGQEFLDDIGKVISVGTVMYEGMGTIKKGFAPDKIYRGNGVTIILKENNEFRTIIKSGEGMDLAIQMVE